MNKLISAMLLALAGLATSGSAMAQWHNSPQLDRDLRACDRRGVNFDRCMWERGWQRGGPGQRWNHNQNWHRAPNNPNWHSPPPNQWNNSPPRRNQPRLSDMQQRALDNCRLLAPAEQPRCRATVMSTVRR
jgi:hypothetical protein